MKIYYAASIWGASGDESFNLEMITHLRTYGRVLSEHLFTSLYKITEHLSMQAIHDRDLGWIHESDRIVAEVSAPSLGVGYELREAVILKKPVLCLWHKQEKKRLSAMISGSSGIHVYIYQSLEEAKGEASRFLLSS